MSFETFEYISFRFEISESGLKWAQHEYYHEKLLFSSLSSPRTSSLIHSLPKKLDSERSYTVYASEEDGRYSPKNKNVRQLFPW